MAQDMAEGRRFATNMASIQKREARLSAGGPEQSTGYAVDPLEGAPPQPRNTMAESLRAREARSSSLAELKGRPFDKGGLGGDATTDVDSTSTFSSNATPPHSVVSL